ncbi:SDR family NAD(P)-dependent oxidoreductase [Salipaludibacillus sp. CF4.18]|uniref:SDR family NAD(P)-dependent oxidoreductase n=1 Tax=Salipaludibacillus sp. CF4.18 TaxID=3373081 RepID=UPI003EE79F1C
MTVNEFTDKVVLITGGASGMGLASAKRFSELGAKVCIMDKNKTRLNEVNIHLSASEDQLMTLECDISVPSQIEKGMKEINNSWGRLDIVFANAGIGGVMAPIETMDIKDWKKTIDIDLTGTFATVKYAIPLLKKQGGSIVITSSISGNRVYSQAGFSCYSTAKAAQATFMKMAALELGQYGIRVNAVCPGGVATNMSENMSKSPEVQNISMQPHFPRGNQPLMKGSADPSQIADAVEFLTSQKASHITGTELYIDGGESLLQG